MLSLSLAACAVDGEQFRGKDRSAFLPAASAHWAIGEPPARDSSALAWQPGVAAGVTRVEGEFALGASRADYAITSVHASFAPELSWRRLLVTPRLGLGYNDFELDAPGASASSDGLGAAWGATAALGTGAPLAPFVRYEGVQGAEVGVRRFEAGLVLWIPTACGVEVAYARQTTELDDVNLLGAPGGDAGRVATEGVHLGLVLRF
jgi:hypothetical protein